AVRIGADFLAKFRKSPVYISNPTWGNHNQIFGDAGFDVRQYKYWDPVKKALAFDEFLDTIKTAPNGSIFVLHTCAHNPTGVDPTPTQWSQICTAMKQKSHFPFFDTAYQGFASGSLDRDAHPIRLFISHNFELFVSQSFAKNFGLYGQRVGCLTMVFNDPAVATKCVTQVQRIVRAMYSSPPAHGARIVATVLGDEGLFEEWKREWAPRCGVEAKWVLPEYVE
ncbi:Golgi Transport, partial [Quaeritorhiza haematococci]